MYVWYLAIPIPWKTNATFCAGWARLGLVPYFLTSLNVQGVLANCGWSNQANSPQLATLNAPDLLKRLPVFPQWPVPVPLLCWRQASNPSYRAQEAFQQGERESSGNLLNTTTILVISSPTKTHQSQSRMQTLGSLPLLLLIWPWFKNVQDLLSLVYEANSSTQNQISAEIPNTSLVLLSELLMDLISDPRYQPALPGRAAGW